MDRIKNIIKSFIPELVLRKLIGLFYGWHGNYPSWEAAMHKCSGYDSHHILERVKASTMSVRNGSAAFERDSFVFDKIQYSYPVLSALLWIGLQNNGKICVLDFGGALGSSYYQNRLFLDKLNDVRWCIVEQTNFVNEGINAFSDKIISFYNTIDECLKKNDTDVILLSSVIQYIEKPYDLLDEILSKKFKYILIDRTPFFKNDDRLTIQKVKPSIYKASYPAWFFNEQKFLNKFNGDYELIYDFETSDKANITSEFKGYFFRKKN